MLVTGSVSSHSKSLCELWWTGWTVNLVHCCVVVPSPHPSVHQLNVGAAALYALVS